LARRLAVLIVAAFPLMGGCVGAHPSAASAGAPMCRSCHEPHHADLGTCVECHRGNASTDRKDLAHDHLLTSRAALHSVGSSAPVVAGGRLVERAACRRCHRIGGEGNQVATELDRVVWDRSQDDLRRAIMAPNGHMPRFGLTGEQADEAIAYLLNVARAGRDPGPYRVYFTRSAAGATGAFETHCGRCHRALTSEGALGMASGGPNLSGLLTPYYPRTAPGEVAWSAAALRDWIHNPRAARHAAVMPPLRLNDGELIEVVGQLRGNPK
jgi:mono/diheme cytochrome c family protein